MYCDISIALITDKDERLVASSAVTKAEVPETFCGFTGKLIKLEDMKIRSLDARVEGVAELKRAIVEDLESELLKIGT